MRSVIWVCLTAGVSITARGIGDGCGADLDDADLVVDVDHNVGVCVWHYKAVYKDKYTV